MQERAAHLYGAVIDQAIAEGEIEPPFDIDELFLLMRMAIAAGSQAETDEGRKALVKHAVSIIFEGLAAARSIARKS